MACVATSALTLGGAAAARGAVQDYTADGTYTVPAGVRTVVVSASGSAGADNTSGFGTGGAGARVRARLAVVAGQQFAVAVGYGGGASSGASGGGGGASDVRPAAGDLSSRLVVAAGGGGAGKLWNGGAYEQDGQGAATSYGKAGTPTAGGAGGVGFNGFFVGGGGQFGTGGGAFQSTGPDGFGAGGGGSNYVAPQAQLLDVGSSAGPAGVAIYWGTEAVSTATAQDFGTAPQGTVGQARTVQFTNTGATGLPGFAFGGANPDDFFVGADTCRDVAPGDTCTATVRFAPQAAGTRTATLSIAGASVTLTGTGGALPTGPTGATGPQGPIGATGATGAAGADGQTGADGADGADGATGADGPTGATGAAGADGATGAAGVAGAQGAQGVAGPPGPQGSVGLTGPQGLRGERGAKGERGARGPIAVYTCQKRRRNGRYRIACFVRVRGGSGSADARTVRVQVRNASGRLYAAGRRTLRKGQTVVPVEGRGVAGSGRYRVTVTVRLNGRTTVLHGAFTLPAA